MKFSFFFCLLLRLLSRGILWCSRTSLSELNQVGFDVKQARIRWAVKWEGNEFVRWMDDEIKWKNKRMKITSLPLLIMPGLLDRRMDVVRSIHGGINRRRINLFENEIIFRLPLLLLLLPTRVWNHQTEFTSHIQYVLLDRVVTRAVESNENEILRWYAAAGATKSLYDVRKFPFPTNLLKMRKSAFKKSN